MSPAVPLRHWILYLLKGVNDRRLREGCYGVYLVGTGVSEWGFWGLPVGEEDLGGRESVGNFPILKSHLIVRMLEESQPYSKWLCLEIQQRNGLAIWRG